MSCGLVFEGGGVRGAYTAGVLDVLAREKLNFTTVYGISAGACNALSFVSGQIGRNREIFARFIQDKRYVSGGNLLRGGSMFGFDFIFGELFHQLLPFDYEAFFSNPMGYQAGATDLETGKIVFFSREELGKNMEAVRASSAQPFLSHPIRFQGKRLLDGSVAQAIPLRRAEEDGCQKNLVVLTRDDSYRKSEKPEYPRPVIRARYWRSPAFAEALCRRGEVYNALRAECIQREKSGSAIVIRPSSPITMSSFCRDPAQLMEVYAMGVQDAGNRLAEIREFMSAL